MNVHTTMPTTVLRGECGWAVNSFDPSAHRDQFAVASTVTTAKRGRPPRGVPR